MAKVIKQGEGEKHAAKSALLNLRDIAAEARSVVLEARKEAARIVEQARSEADSVRKEASEAGYQEGLARGRHDGYEQGRQEALAEARRKLSEDSASLLELAGKVVGQLDEARATVLQQGREEALTFAIALAERIVGHIAAADVAAARQNLAKAMDRAGCTSEITVRVNPRQLEALRTYCADLTDALGIRGGVELVADERISPGGVRVQTTSGEIDATVEKQLQNVVEALLGEQKLRTGQMPVAGSQGLYVTAQAIPREQHESA
ncbi:MAG: FliH/SctL family protein [Phycisphaerae bacterium]